MAALACPAPKGAVLTPGAARLPQHCGSARRRPLVASRVQALPPQDHHRETPAGVRPGDTGVGFPREGTVPREQTWAEGPGHTAPRPGLWKSKPGVAGQPVLEAAARCLGSQTGPLVHIACSGAWTVQVPGPRLHPRHLWGVIPSHLHFQPSPGGEETLTQASPTAELHSQSESARALSAPSPSSLILSIGQLKPREGE